MMASETLETSKMVMYKQRKMMMALETLVTSMELKIKKMMMDLVTLKRVLQLKTTLTQSVRLQIFQLEALIS